MTYPARLNLSLYRNDDYVEEFTFTDGTSEANPGDPIDFTGWSSAMDIRLYAGASGAALISLATVTTDIQGVRYMGAGVWRVRIQDTAINGLPTSSDDIDAPVTLAVDWVFTDPTGDRHNYAAGEAVVYQKVTA